MYVGVTYTATLSKTLARYVTCEKCGCQFTFIAKGFGYARSGGAAGDAEKYVSDMATSRANEAAASAMSACPDCGWHNRNAIEFHRRQTFRTQKTVVGAFSTVAVLALRAMYGGPGSFIDTTLIVLAAAGAGISAIVLFLLQALEQRHDPNRDWPAGRLPFAIKTKATRTPEYEEQMTAWRAEAARLAWYYIIAGQNHGPVSFAQLGQLLRSGRLQMTDVIWAEGMSEWAAAITVVK